MEASRAFICVRPQTYENASEVEQLESVFAPGGVLRNTSFALLTPEGEKIGRGGRSPDMVYRSPERFVSTLQRLARQHESSAKAIAALPTHRDLRLGLNVAAADIRPLVVIRAQGEKAARALAERVATFAWSADGVGRAHYVVLSEASTYADLTPEPGISVIHPDSHGQGGRVLVHLPPDEAEAKLPEALDAGLVLFQGKTRNFRQHMRDARRRGIEWETEVPVTDPGPTDRNRRRAGWRERRAQPEEGGGTAGGEGAR